MILAKIVYPEQKFGTYFLGVFLNKEAAYEGFKRGYPGHEFHFDELYSEGGGRLVLETITGIYPLIGNILCQVEE